jgi:hypothetical protein
MFRFDGYGRRGNGMMPRDKPRSDDVGRILHNVLRRIDPQRRLPAFEVWNFWNDAVGEALARRAQPSGYRNGVLFITVAAHSWMQELQFMKETLRERLNTRLGSEMIRDIEFVSGAVAPPVVTEEPPSTREEVEIAPHRPIALPEIEDPELAAVFRRLVEAHSRRRRFVKPKD